MRNILNINRLRIICGTLRLVWRVDDGEDFRDLAASRMDMVRDDGVVVDALAGLDVEDLASVVDFQFSLDDIHELLAFM